MGLGIPPLRSKILLESNPLKSGILVRRLAHRATRGRGLLAAPLLLRRELAPLLLDVLRLRSGRAMAQE